VRKGKSLKQSNHKGFVSAHPGPCPPHPEALCDCFQAGEGDDKELEECWRNASAIMFQTSAYESTVWSDDADTKKPRQ
jgi:hypothetical protein